MVTPTILAVGKITPRHRSLIVAPVAVDAAVALNAYLEASVSKPELKCAPDGTLQAMIDAAHVIDATRLASGVNEARTYFGFDDDAPMGLVFTVTDGDDAIEDDYEFIRWGGA